MARKKTKKKELTNLSLKAFWATVGIFCLLLASFLVPVINQSLKGAWFMLLPGLFSLSGVVLIWLVIREGVKRPLRKFLLLTGGSAAGFLTFSVLHNLLYATEIITKEFLLVSRLAGLLHALFFLIAVIVCPIGFITGVLGSIVKLRKD